jgi:hypothetical protein
MATRAIKGKATPAEVVRQAQIDARGRRARPPREDPSGACYAALAALAVDHSLDVGALIEEWSERAAMRAMVGGLPLAEAERLAVEDVRENVRRRVA